MLIGRINKLTTLILRAFGEGGGVPYDVLKLWFKEYFY
jgi:hypothetical protein